MNNPLIYIDPSGHADEYTLDPVTVTAPRTPSPDQMLLAGVLADSIPQYREPTIYVPFPLVELTPRQTQEMQEDLAFIIGLMNPMPLIKDIGGFLGLGAEKENEEEAEALDVDGSDEPIIRTPGTRVNIDGTLKKSSDQQKQIDDARRSGKPNVPKDIKNKKSKQNVQNNLRNLRNVPIDEIDDLDW